MDWFLYDNGLRHERVKDTGVLNMKDSVKNAFLWLLQAFSE